MIGRLTRNEPVDLHARLIDYPRDRLDPGLATFFLQLNAQYEEPRLWLSLNLRFWDRRRPQLAHFQLGLARSHPPTPDLTQPVI